ncbi:prepilin-type N-terminal cleavage/methylation domain-containing protein [Alkalimonas collagenimarina]|uniref:Prepilin-type N-terminal cleavage/methylation domain-containing protein n=1 Tax=Alkalimonas collagenimarina TaxID=400390 RepID=A0ABT9H3X1_9GAMM|nr:prepilin-type N-terminal cleavage/methylation domain-containing protein [Alkalimonas collagenimarina]MDP4537759.1 prepilin-type N-terminal cleavage/methylation domain-containing protein [Alkalimonas collagenimarina]
MASRGFTLIELVTSIVLLSILALSVTSYLGVAARMYVDVTDREQLLAQSRFAIERLSRELRNATPNSVRVNTNAVATCLEFTPFLESGRYIQASVAPDESDQVEVIGAESVEATSFFSPNLPRLVIYPRPPAAASEPDPIYDGVSPANVLVSGWSANEPDSSVYVLQLAEQHSFSQHSPERRWYLLSSPLSYCVVQEQLVRYSDYGFYASQPMPGAGLANGVLMAEHIVNLNMGEPVFRHNEAVLNRNAVVNIYFRYGRDLTDDTFFNHEVHILNVP